MAYIRKVVIFGATGRTGVCCVETALNKGHDVTAFVRDPSRLPSELSYRVNVVTGDATNPRDVEDAIMGQDAVIIVLGTGSDTSPTTMMSEGTQNVVEGMQKYGVMRLSVCLSTFLMWEPEKIPAHYYNINEEHKRMLEVVKSSDREWIAVCPPHISDDPGHGDYIVAEGQRAGRTISKFDLADFLVTCLSDDSNVNKMFAVADRS